jgi:hypothetical protein
MVLGKLDICLQKTKQDAYLSPCISINSRWFKDLNISPDILKLVQARAGNILEATGIGNDFLNRTQLLQQLRDRTGK